MNKFLFFLSLLTLPFLFMNAQKAYLIDNNIAIFYPEQFDPQSHLPSFALMEEPNKYADLPEDWDVNVLFTETFGKSVAYIDAGQADLYGTGEVTGPLLRNGTVRKLWNTDSFGYKIDRGQRLYQTHPWVLAVRKDGSAFGVLADNTWKQELSLGAAITFTSDSKPFRVIIIKKNSPQLVIQALAELTGKIDLPPLWSLGYQQCRWSYYPNSRVKEIADTFRIKNIPCDVIWMDIHYMDNYKVFTFSEDEFPNPKETNQYLHEKGFKSIWMIDPGVKVEKGYSVYDSGTKKDVWVKNAIGESFIGKVWPGDCVFPDFTQEKTNKWWAALYKNYMATGIDGVWNDMNEPAVFENSKPGEAAMNGLTDWTMPFNNMHLGGKTLPKDIHLRYHNVYGMMMVKASRKGIMQANPKKRPFVLTRSNYLGGQRYAATWTGDNESTWEHLKMSIPMSLNFGLSGQPFNGPDIGGFGGNATRSLFGHWIALGAFYPFSRAHSIHDSKPHEPWAFGKKIEDVSRIAIQRRYRLLPYLYTLFHTSSINGMPIMRPVFFADITDANLRTEEEAFLLGSDLLIVPKWADHPTLPAGNWQALSLVGENSKTDTYQPDVKLRPGAILPLGKIIQNTTEYNLNQLTLIVNLNENGEATGTLYHDAGNGYAYKKGQYSTVNFSAQKKGNRVIVQSKIEGVFLDKKSIIHVEIITKNGVKRGDGNYLADIEIQL